MSIKAIERVDSFKKENKPLPMHTKDSLIKRGKIYSAKMMDKKCRHYNVSLLSSYDEQIKNIYKYRCDKCDSEYVQYHNSYFICRKCNPIVRSKYEEEILSFLGEFFSTHDIIKNYRKPFNGKSEIDIFIPSKNIGIEFNGLFWHSEVGGNKDKKYHISKTELCNSEGIRLIHIFEDDWINKKELIKDKLKYILKINQKLPRIYARQCIIKYIDNADEKRRFLIKNHIQGDDTSSIKIGCYYNNELVSVMTFGTPNIIKGYKDKKEGVFELIRFCSDTSKICIGTFSKMLSFFIQNHNPKQIITYADICWSSKNDNIYIKNGFKQIGITSPNYWYTNDYKNRIHRFKFTKQNLIKMGHDSSKTEWEIMKSIGYDRIWDCGHIKYSYHF